MGLINIEQLLAPITETEPSGPNLEYDSAFSELERAVQGKAEQRIGSVHVPFEPPDWSAVCKQCLALLERTRDLRVTMHLALGLLHCNGLVGFADGLELAGGLVRDFWQSVHPEVDHEDNDDPTMRITALATLNAPSTLLALQQSPLAQLRGLGAVSIHDVRAAAGGGTTAQGDSVVSSATVDAVFQAIEFDSLEAMVSGVQRCLDGVAAIDGAFVTHTGSRGPDLSALSQLLREVSQLLTPRLNARKVAEQADQSQDDATGAAAEGGNPNRTGGALSGDIRSREDVLRAIDKICAYYTRSEPTSPLPLLLERCKRLVSSSFLEIVQELLPDSVAHVNSIAGRKPG